MLWRLKDLPAKKHWNEWHEVGGRNVTMDEGIAKVAVDQIQA
jgi:hypothetical protein